jgi:glutaredoxin-like protein NrdH
MKPVTLYTLPSCVQCTTTKRFLTKQNIEFSEVNLSEDAEAMERVREMGYQSAPVVVAGDEHWSGFRPDKLNQLLS